MFTRYLKKRPLFRDLPNKEAIGGIAERGRVGVVRSSVTKIPIAPMKEVRGRFYDRATSLEGRDDAVSDKPKSLVLAGEIHPPIYAFLLKLFTF